MSESKQDSAHEPDRTRGPASEGVGQGEQVAVARRAGLVAVGTLSSRVLGAVRDSVIAAYFTKGATDAWWAAFTIPNALRSLLAEGAVGSAFVPVFAEVRAKEGLERARQFYSGLVGVMLVILSAVTLVGMVATRGIVTLYSAGFQHDAAKFDTTVTLTRIVFPYIFFMGVAALGMGVLNAMKRFFVPAVAPGLLNVPMIAAPWVFVPLAIAFGLPPVISLAFGALVGGLLQVIAQFPALKSIGMLNIPRFAFSDPYVRKALRLMAPLLIGLGIYQVNLILSRQMLSYLPEGATSYFNYGSRMVDIPQGVFALALASATLPSLAAMRNRGEHAEVKKLFGYALRLSLFVAVPATALLVVLAAPTCTVLYARGEFGILEVHETARSLVWQAGGIWAVASVRMVVPMFYAYNDTKTPVLCSTINLIVFGSVSLLLMKPMQHAGIAVGLTAGNTAHLLAAVLLLRRKSGRLGLKTVAVSLLRILISAAAMSAAAYGVARLADWERGGNNLLNIAVYVAALVVSAVVYFAVARVLRSPEVSELLAALRRRRTPR
ncbi:MAG: murein biosynthesis integral membrane protein MurJ [Sandaracinaceae bacterium]|nr:murein biosynthesis integral membrane protein MurJ [Sandaracinaceae bacterium]